MKEIADVIIIIIAFAVFGYSHSLLASKKVKIFIADKFGELMAFYRIIYNFISLLSFYILYELVPHPDMIIYDLPYPWDFVMLALQVLSLAGLFWSAKYFNTWEFIGISQIVRWIRGNYAQNELDEKYTFKEEGPYRLMRHPVYFFSITFLLFRPVMDLFYLTLFLCIAAYFYAGSIYEEKKLEEEFGEVYTDYVRRVPRIFPYKLKSFNS
ncbi:MAG: isoprenylcysteine carboxylmethyltransferase family protein [Ignavibacteriales bacterium]|nr:MAG: isoprenylcysteine carboxylmethyltransferase family protein [Ignavibacteriales bacterium]